MFLVVQDLGPVTTKGGCLALVVGTNITPDGQPVLTASSLAQLKLTMTDMMMLLRANQWNRVERLWSLLVTGTPSIALQMIGPGQHGSARRHHDSPTCLCWFWGEGENGEQEWVEVGCQELNSWERLWRRSWHTHHHHVFFFFFFGSTWKATAWCDGAVARAGGREAEAEPRLIPTPKA